MNLEQFEYIEQYFEGKLNGPEKLEFENKLKNDPVFNQQVEDFQIAAKSIEQHNRLELKKRLASIHQDVIVNKGSKLIKRIVVAGAALIIGITAVVLIRQGDQQNIQKPQQQQIIVQNDKNSQNTDNTSLQTDEINLEEQTKPTATSLEQHKTPVPVVSQNDQGKASTSATDEHTNESTAPTTSIGQTYTVETDNSAESGYDQPVLHFGVAINSGCAPFEVQFYDSSVASGKQIVKYLWNFGDGKTSTLPAPKHIYRKNGTFDVSLTVWDEDNVSQTLVRNQLIQVMSTPKANFEVDRSLVLLENANIKFSNKSSNTSEKTSYNWDFGDYIGTSKLLNPNYCYNDTGAFTVKLTVQNASGCSDIFISSILVLENVTFYPPGIFRPDNYNDPDNSVFHVQATGIIEFHLKVFDRKGTLLYESDDYDTHGWDGTSSYGIAPSGVYVWKCKIKGLDHNYYDRKGTVTLVR